MTGLKNVYDFDAKGVRPTTWESGPVEMVNTPTSWNEILRTETTLPVQRPPRRVPGLLDDRSAH